MFRLLKKSILLSSLFAIYAFANDAMISQMANGFFSKFFPGFLLIAVITAILSVGLTLAQKKPEILAYGCGGVFLLTFICGLLLIVIEFIKASNNKGGAVGFDEFYNN